MVKFVQNHEQFYTDNEKDNLQITKNMIYFINKKMENKRLGLNISMIKMCKIPDLIYMYKYMYIHIKLIKLIFRSISNINVFSFVKFLKKQYIPIVILRIISEINIEIIIFLSRNFHAPYFHSSYFCSVFIIVIYFTR